MSDNSPHDQTSSIYGIDPRSGERIGLGYPAGSVRDVERLCEAAARAFDEYRETRLEHRATFLERIAEEILATGDELVDTAVRETALPKARIEGERGRTVTQLRLFADVVREGSWLGLRLDSPLPERQPAPRPDLRLRHLPLGPVAVFGASNFPLAFSVAGGDTASALAAGCPVVVKAHPAHPGTSQLVADAILRAVQACEMPAGTFGMIHSADNTVAGALVADPRIKAIGFTGSRQGGLALMAIAANRPEPIPVYAEMSSINPVVVLPEALAARGATIAQNYIASLALGVGQFCTNPGLLIALRGPTTDAFVQNVATSVATVGAGTMLNPQIHSSFNKRLAAIETAAGVELVGRGEPAGGPFDAAATVFTTSAAQFASNPALAEEIFGPAGLVVQCETISEVREVLERLEGQLTIAVHMEPGDYPIAAELLPLLERKAGRILANGFGTGVEVSHAMVHGGPFPATSDGRSTSVGSLAINRFLRPVCYQDLPEEVLPGVLRDDNPEGLRRFVDGSFA
jgi:NADP-dependent aldehyde dehydrogenase